MSAVIYWTVLESHTLGVKERLRLSAPFSTTPA
ncbi:hypothetical protein GBAR_LOCUS8554 [Geodia barretti]|uniref:Uncharacterized protein n=1 Tax=Geodia barretti TaxID=519541 RepID=A0AA35RL27_GEOBA|nr:hypothetical protein GBAR_LOCUS8554 [Geodia barretti]